jgi:Penicillin-binding protein-related factor A, putative recombinase
MAGYMEQRNTAPKDPRRQYQGAVNRVTGKTFEQVIDASLAYYDHRGEALVLKTPEPMRPTKSVGDGKFIAFYEKRAQPDYKGALRGGRAVVFEAKHTTAARIEQSRVTREQAEVLGKYTALGAECFVFVGFDMREFFRVPWTVWEDMKNQWGRKYVTPKDLESYRAKIGYNGVILILEGINAIQPIAGGV